MTLDAIERLRTGRRAELVSTLAFVLAVGLGTVHWAGLVAGGALVGFLAPSVRRALVLGLYVGGTVVVLFVAYLWLFGAAGKFLAMGPLTLLSLAVGLLYPVLGAAVRGLY
jgi:hypothetical protein